MVLEELCAIAVEGSAYLLLGQYLMTSLEYRVSYVD
jgi:hypothetical protein